MNKQLMVDLETMSLKSNASIASIGACYFDINKGTIGDKLYITVDIDSCKAYGLDIMGQNIIWWLNQSEDAQKALTDPVPLDLKLALNKLTYFIGNNQPTIEVWSHATFDEVILQNAYSAIGQEAPWMFRNVRDIRTLTAIWKTLCKSSRTPDMQGVKHHALDDAIHQAEYCSKMWRDICVHSLKTEK